MNDNVFDSSARQYGLRLLSAIVAHDGDAVYLGFGQDFFLRKALDPEEWLKAQKNAYTEDLNGALGLLRGKQLYLATPSSPPETFPAEGADLVLVAELTRDAEIVG